LLKQALTHYCKKYNITGYCQKYRNKCSPLQLFTVQVPHIIKLSFENGNGKKERRRVLPTMNTIQQSTKYVCNKIQNNQNMFVTFYFL